MTIRHNRKKLWNFDEVVWFLSIILVLQTAISPFFSMELFFVLLPITLLSLIGAGIRIWLLKERLEKSVSKIAYQISDEHSDTLNSFSVPVLFASPEGEIIWYNRAFSVTVAGDTELLGEKLETVLDADSIELLNDMHNADIAYNNKLFTVFDSASGENKVYYFVDQTSLKRTAYEYSLSRPAVAILAIDSLDELLGNARDSEKIRINGLIQNAIEAWFAPANGILKTLSNDRFMLIFDERSLRFFMEGRFEILEQIRKIEVGAGTTLTLSAGVGHDCPTLRECEDLARQALDMALGRGGDQVALKSPSGDYQFFGGVKAASEKHTRVRTRIVASALSELIAGSDRILLMGHKYSDLDCLGAAYAFASAIESIGKPVHIVLNRKNTLAKPLLQYIEAEHAACSIVDDAEILPMIDRKTLLIILDTHRPSFVDYEAVYEACKTVVVIDHHRKAVDYIENAVIFYHETAASSACEMTAELIQYMNATSISSVAADALLAGIMLDTRNFVLHTGVRTFEAAAFLRQRGANPVVVKKLFAGSMPTYRQRVSIVASAEFHEGFAIAKNEIQDENSRVATSQAADELLNIDGVRASFVMCLVGDSINISARSLGEVNVQLIMESLGGGGHRTMAACQLPTTNFDEAKAQLLKALETYQKDR